MLKRWSLHKVENWFLLAAILLSLFVRLRHLDIAFERDEGEYAYAAQAILRGELPYRDFYNMKLPGVYYSYTVLFWLFGDTLRTIKLSLIGINFLNTFLIFLIAKKLTQESVAKFSAAAYLLLSLGWFAEGWVANSEHFVLITALFGVYAALRATDNSHSNWTAYSWLLGSGMSMASAFLCKQHAFFYVIFIPIWLIINHLLKSDRKNWFKLPPQYFIQNLAFGLGILVAFGCMFGFIVAQNIYEPFQFFTRDYAQAYVSIASNPFRKIDNFFPILGDNFPLWFLAAGSFFGIFLKKEFSSTTLFLIVFAILTTACVFPGGYFRFHYFQLMFPALALLSGLGFDNLKNLVLPKFFSEKQAVAAKSNWKSPQSLMAIFSLLVFVAVSPRYVVFGSSRVNMQHHYIGSHFTEMKEIGEYLAKNTTPDATIGMVADEPQIAFHARRRLASGFLYSFPLFEKQRYAEQMRNQFIQEIEAKKPEILIYSCATERDEDDFLVNPQILNWFLAYAANYEVIGKLYNRGRRDAELRWRTPTDDLSDDAHVQTYVFRRKTPLSK